MNKCLNNKSPFATDRRVKEALNLRSLLYDRMHVSSSSEDSRHSRHIMKLIDGVLSNIVS